MNSVKQSQRAVLLLFLLGICAVLAYELPYAILGENAHVRYDDTYDHQFSIRAGCQYAYNQDDKVYPFVLGGLPKAAFDADPKIYGLYFAFLSPYWAVRLHDLLSRFVAFIGMFLLLRDFRYRCLLATWGISVAYSFLPYWQGSGFAVSGLPLVVWAARVLLRRPGAARSSLLATALAIFALYPFTSEFTRSSIYFLAGLPFVWAWFALRKGNRAPLLVLAWVLMAASVWFANRHLIAACIGPDAIEWNRVTVDRSLSRSILLSLYLIVHSEALQAPANHYPFFWYAALIYLAALGLEASPLRNRFRPLLGSGNAARRALPFVLLGFLLLIGIFAYTLFHVGLLVPFLTNLSRKLQFVGTIQFRLFFFSPMVIYLTYYYVLAAMWKKGRLFRVLAVGVFLMQIGSNYSVSDWLARRRDWPSYAQFESERLFDLAAQRIGKPRYSFRIACFGFHPGIAHMNGFRTVDGYFYLYPLEYKRRFRPVIAGELERSPQLKSYFDNWGNVCYILSSELMPHVAGNMDEAYITKRRGVGEVRKLEINTAALASLGASYVFSTVRINNAPRNHLQLLDKVEDPGAAIDLYLYEILPQP